MSFSQDPKALIPVAAVISFQKVADRVELPAGQQFITENDFEESLYLIESGQVEVERSGTILGTIDAGDVVGEIAFIDRR
ncbi:MAG: cyclic nucleotide-binding domain-containing protein, partial [Planctomycetota bacterium]